MIISIKNMTIPTIFCGEKRSKSTYLVITIPVLCRGGMSEGCLWSKGYQTHSDAWWWQYYVMGCFPSMDIVPLMVWIFPMNLVKYHTILPENLWGKTECFNKTMIPNTLREAKTWLKKKHLNVFEWLSQITSPEINYKNIKYTDMKNG